MRSRKVFPALVVAVSLAFVAACSSSSSGSGSTESPVGDAGKPTGDGGPLVSLPPDIGGSQVSCAGTGSSVQTKACFDCQARNCKAQAQAVFGTDPKKFGGACAAFNECVCACAPTDSQCVFGCLSKAEQPCKDAGQALDACVLAACSNDAGTGVCD
jgi:hypothetical protein